MVAHAEELGVPLLNGTDSPPIPGMFAGYSVHDEESNAQIELHRKLYQSLY